MEKDDLDIIVEKYLTQRIHAPRVELSNDFKAALLNEVQRLYKQGIKAKRILAAIDFITQSTVNDKTIQQVEEPLKEPQKQEKPLPLATPIERKLRPKSILSTLRHRAGL